MKVQPNINQAMILSESANPKSVEKEYLNEIFNFKSALKDAQIVSSQGVVQELIQKFERQEKVVMKNPTVANISEYKRVIKELVSIASQNYKCEEINIYSSNGFQKNLSLSNVIDKKLNNIVDDFMSTNRLSLESLSEMEEIKGLILNVFV